MTVIGEKTATYATLVDDIAGALTSFSNWSDADSYVVNDGTAKASNDDGSTPQDTDWHNNARVLEDSNTGTFLLMYLHGSRYDNHDNDDVSGIRFVYSSDWDATEHHPAGDTNVESADDGNLRDGVGFYLTDTYADRNNEGYDRWNGGTFGVWGSSNNLSRDTIRGNSVSYVISANSDGLNIGLWNNNDGNNGIASITVFEYLDNRFFNDTAVPFVALTQTTHRCHSIAYGFDSYWTRARTWNVDRVGYPSAPVEEADWGIINPSSEDDTFFFRYPAAFNNTSQDVPVAYLREAIPNDYQEGGAHGDDFTHDSTTYKIFKKSGASTNNVVSAGLRHE
ncbi:hypothetical protein [Natrinema marinum]|uniref:hypothetical protein n=1 Tax=Natrinema marinum TaxID=2961598 RepID=UPI0020C891FA|nr:hypothetical protein [Natrinema marinum]